MSPTRSLARPMLAALFVTSGIDVLRNPGPRVEKAEEVASQLAAKAGLPQNTEMLVRVNAATHVVAGTLLAMGRLRRISALALMASLIPTTYAGHRFWEVEDPRERAQQQSHFLKNLAVMGGLLLEAVDAEGRPSLGWRSQRATRRAVAATVARGPAAATSAAGAAATKVAGAARGVAASHLVRDATEATAKTLGASTVGASAVADKLAGLARTAARADLVTDAADKAKTLAKTAAATSVARRLTS